MARDPADCSKNDNVNANASGLMEEVTALRRRLAALEERLQENPPKEPPGRQAKPRASRKTVAWVSTGAMLAMLAGVSVVYGQSAVDAFFISKEGDVGIGPSGALFVGKQGNVGIGPSRFVSSGYKLLVSTPGAKTSTSTSEAAGLAVTTNETDNPFGLGIRLKGAPALADRSAVLVTTDVNLAEGGRLVLQPDFGNVGIGTYAPKAENKLEVNGKIAANSFVVDNAHVQTSLTAGSLTVEKDATLKGSMKIAGGNALEFGAGVPDKQVDAGKILYGGWNTDALNIIGAGGKAENRKIYFFAEGGATFSGNLDVSGTVVGNIKTRLQVNNTAETTLTKPNWRYHMTLTGGDVGGGAKTRTIPKDVLIALCGEPDGCNVVLGRRLWSADETTTWSDTFHFTYNKDTQGFRSDSPFSGRVNGSTANREGVVIAGKAVDGYCYLTNETVENNQSKGNIGAGMQLLLDSGKRPERICELTLIP